jgi:hypothetical protein
MTDEVNGIPIQFYNPMKWPDSWAYKPNGDMRQCQCVMAHWEPFEEGAIAQCPQSRSSGSDLYCYHCEADHGKKHNAALAEKEAKKKK